MGMMSVVLLTSMGLCQAIAQAICQAISTNPHPAGELRCQLGHRLKAHPMAKMLAKKAILLRSCVATLKHSETRTIAVCLYHDALSIAPPALKV